MIIVDSSVWIDFFNGVETRESAQLADLLPNEQIGIGDLILAEVLQGFSSDSDFNIAKDHFSLLTCYAMVSPVYALTSAINYRRLRRQGITIRKTVDMLIGTFCIENDFQLLHSDRDFDYLHEYLGLKVI